MNIELLSISTYELRLRHAAISANIAWRLLQGQGPDVRYLFGGIAAGDIEVGYGPARLIDSATVKEREQLLKNMGTTQLRDNCSPREMEKLAIYPEIRERDGEEGTYSAENYEALKSFIATCVTNNLGMALYLC